MHEGIAVLNSKAFKVIVAITPEEKARGLMYIDPPLPPMAFVYNSPRPNQYWMRNVRADLDIVFCLTGKIAQIASARAYSQTRLNPTMSDLVIELPYGTCAANGIRVGQTIEFAVL